MRKGLSAAFDAINLAVAMAVFAGLMWWFAKAHSHMWRLVAPRYAGGPSGQRIATKVPESIIVTGRGTTGGIYSGNAGYRIYAGASIAIHEQGLALSQVPPFNVMCPRLFLPFDQMELADTSWGLTSDVVAIRMRDLPELDILVFRRVVRWVREHVDERPFGLDV